MAVASWVERPPRGLWEYVLRLSVEPSIEFNASGLYSVPKTFESAKIYE
jgi:hypothetical protein